MLHKRFKMQPTFKIIEDKLSWVNVLQSIDSYDFYHTYDYHELSKTTNEKPILVVFKSKDILIAIPFLLRKIFDTDYFDLTSVYGYAGPLQKNITKDFDNTKFASELVHFFTQKKIVSVFSRLNPFISNQEIILNGLGNITELGRIVNINIVKTVEEQKKDFSKTTKRYINRTNKLCDIVSLKDPKSISVFKNLYYENMDRVQAKKSYYFSEKYFNDFVNSSDFKTDILFAILKETGEIIAAAIFITTNKIVQYHISGTKNDYLHLTPIRILINYMRIKATEAGFTYFNLGGGLSCSEDSLFNFKSSFSKDFKSFKVWKQIIYEDVYKDLANEFATNTNNQDYFPAYRNS